MTPGKRDFRALIVAAGLAALFVVLFLHLEAQWAIALLALGLVLGLYFAVRAGLLARVQAAASHHPRAAIAINTIAGIAIIAVLREEHFALLMLATVCLFVTVCLGLTIQFGYAGIVNFAGIAFFGIGAYTTAVLTAHSAIPHLLIIIVSGLVSGLIGYGITF